MIFISSAPETAEGPHINLKFIYLFIHSFIYLFIGWVGSLLLPTGFL